MYGLAAAAFDVATRELLLIVAVGIAISSLDDLFIDIVYFLRTAWRRLTVYRRHGRATAEAMRRANPGAMAIIVPAWDESAVIGAMLADLTRRLDYPDYRVFVGVYPNDAATRAAVIAVADRHIRLVACSRPGPTTKADCLNHLWRAVVGDEIASGRRFKAVVLHDAEDVVHPLELTVYDALIPRLAMVQLPVLPLPDHSSRWISGHYLDEFAEQHTKDLVVREALGAAVPSAGVACAIDRDLLGRIADLALGAPFDAACLTEDYELGHRIKALGGRGALVRVKSAHDRVVVATREHFPATLDAAVRQKSRWLTGIALSGWDRLGWPGGIADRYMLLRDRKSIVASLLVVGGYGAAALAAVDATLRLASPAMRALPPLIGPALTWLLVFNAGLLGWRLLMRALFTGYAHGWRQALRSVPRAVVSNLVNALAAWRAVTSYRAILTGRTRQTWDKTAHRYPGAS